tara:strand:+ start:869 stop:3085 length:2217 start_codon:yes stop_codon:yes gene_type:complete
MSDYNKFLETKTKSHISSGFDIEESELSNHLFDFQKYIVKAALKKGQFAIFADCGLGKTLMQLSWAFEVHKKTNKKVLILCPLAIVEQTKKEAVKFNIDLTCFDITNFEQLKNIDVSNYSGVVLDESSILKGKDGNLSNLIINSFNKTPYKLACSATPSPNQHLELGMHVNFLGVDTYDNMKSMFFVQDAKIKKSDKWRLKQHAVNDFWKYVCSWSISVDNPATLGFNADGYSLPEIEYVEHIIPIENESGNLFNSVNVSATDINKDLKRSLDKRIEKVKELVNNSDKQWLIWGLQNAETDLLNKEIDKSFNVHGSLKPEIKADKLNGFAKNEFQNLITKTSIASFGLNYQNCSNMIFCSYDFKFEAFYQAVRRSYRFGQKNKVTVHLLVPETQQNVRSTIIEKQKKHNKMIKEMAKYSAETEYMKESKELTQEQEEVKNDSVWLMNGDCVEKLKKIEDNSIDYSFFSPPFSSLYTYSDDPKDISNVKNDCEFYKHFTYVVKELKRVIKSGRLVSMHVMQGTTGIGKDGFYSIKDLRGDLIRLFQKEGFYFHAEKMIRKSPQLAAIRTKNHQLMHGSTKKDSSICRPGLADYILTFRNKGKNEVPIQNEIDFDNWCKIAEPAEYVGDIEINTLQRINDQLWMDIEEGDTISSFRKAKGEKDEKHMTPTQLTVIENSYLLWSNKGDTVLSPFGGVGSESVTALKMDRKPIAIELKNSYYEMLKKNISNQMDLMNQTSLF